MVTLTRLSRRSVWLARFSQPFLYVIVQCGAPELSPVCSLAHLDKKSGTALSGHPLRISESGLCHPAMELSQKKGGSGTIAFVGTVDAGFYIKLP